MGDRRKGRKKQVSPIGGKGGFTSCRSREYSTLVLGGRREPSPSLETKIPVLYRRGEKRGERETGFGVPCRGSVSSIGEHSPLYDYLV